MRVSQGYKAAMLVFIASAGLGASAALATEYKVDSGASEVEFTAVGKPGFLRINGKGAKVDGNASVTDKGASGVFKTKLTELATGIDMRDEHMKTKYLETGKFPEATLKWTTQKGVESGDVPFKGKLTLHGVTKDVEGTAKLDPSSDKKDLGVEASFTIKLSDYKIDIPSYLGVTVAEDVDVHVKFNAKAG